MSPASWQAAPCLLSQDVQRFQSLVPFFIRELPRRTLFYACRSAFGGLPMRLPHDAAFDRGHILQRGAEQFLLLGAVRAPIQSVHFCSGASHALCECVEPVGSLAEAKIVGRSKGGDYQYSYDQLANQPRGSFCLGFPLQLPLSS